MHLEPSELPQNTTKRLIYHFVLQLGNDFETVVKAVLIPVLTFNPWESSIYILSPRKASHDIQCTGPVDV